MARGRLDLSRSRPTLTMVRAAHGVNRVRLLGRLLIAAGIALGVVALILWQSGNGPAAEPAATVTSEPTATASSVPAPTATPSATPTALATATDPTEYAAALVVGTNAARATEGLAALEPSACAASAARSRVHALTGGKALEHASLGPVITACAPASTAAENLSRGAAAPGAIMAAWLASPGHRANLLDPTLTELGVACVLDQGEMLCSQVFLGP